MNQNLAAAGTASATLTESSENGQYDLRQRTVGFRFSAADAVVLTGAAFVGGMLWQPLPDAAMAIAVAVAHFFLFCNVFRISRRLELVWAVALVVNVVLWSITSGNWSWVPILAVQTPITALLLVMEMWSPLYHGVGSQQFNPRLDEYLRGDI